MTIGSTEAVPLAVTSAPTDQAGARGAGAARNPDGPIPAPREGTGGPAVAAERTAAERAAAAERAVEQVAKTIQLPEFRRYELMFRRDKELDRVVVQVIDGKTRAVVRTIPPEELARALRQLRAPRGMLLDQES